MLKILICTYISVEYEFKSGKFKGYMLVALNILNLRGSTTELTLRNSKLYRFAYAQPPRKIW